MMEAVSSSETSVNVYQTTWCNIPEDSHIQTMFDSFIFPNPFTLVLNYVYSRSLLFGVSTAGLCAHPTNYVESTREIIFMDRRTP
jgi:hypothetical protein